MPGMSRHRESGQVREQRRRRSGSRELRFLEKQAILQNGATDAAAPNFSNVLGFVRSRGKDTRRSLCCQARKRICCAPLVVAVIEVGLAMELVRAGFGDGVDHSPGGAAVFRGIVRSVYLKLLHGRLGDGVPDARAAALFGKERLVVVAAVDG